MFKKKKTLKTEHPVFLGYSTLALIFFISMDKMNVQINWPRRGSLIRLNKIDPN